MKKSIAVFLFITLLTSCLKDEPLKLSYEGYTPVALNDGWEISNPVAEGMNAQLLEDAFRQVYWQDGFIGARSLLVFRNGKLVAEAYPSDSEHINEISNIQSITKSFTSVLTGIALNKGDLDSIDNALYNIYPEYFDEDLNKRNITLKHVLTMTTGLDYDNDGNFLEFYQNDGNSAKYVLTQPLISNPGSIFNYNDGAPQLISKAIESSTGKTLGEYGHENLFAPLNISNYSWEKAKDSSNFGAFGLFMTPRDLGKFGQLLLNQGDWNGQQIVDSSWIDEITTINQNLAGGGGQYFGYYLWLNPSNGTFAARGNGGQFIYVSPPLNLVIVYTASPSTSDYLNYEQNLINSIVNSCY